NLASHVNLKELAHPSPINHIFYNDTTATEIYTLSLHDALPISERNRSDVMYTIKINGATFPKVTEFKTTKSKLGRRFKTKQLNGDRKSTRLNSSHVSISYAVFCLKKKTKKNNKKMNINRKVPRK